MEGRDGWLPVREAWQRALYGPAGFYRRHSPGDHFRTSVHASPLFAEAILTLVRRLGLASVVDYGAGEGELLVQLRRLAPDLRLVGVDLRRRPGPLPPDVEWRADLPDRVDGLLVANELLDNVPCDVVERDDAGAVRIVEVHPPTGAQRLGSQAPPEATAWSQTWWPLEESGQRAEIGSTRDDLWAAACGAVRRGGGVALAVDYGHRRHARPPFGTLASYLAGALRPPTFDGRHDLTAHVAVDAVAARVGADLRTQRDSLRGLGLDAGRPPLSRAVDDPAGYVRALSRTTRAGELTASPGLGDFFWVLTGAGERDPLGDGR